MKTNKLIILLAILITGYSANAKEPEKTVLLANFEAINSQTLERIQNFVQAELSIRIRATTIKQTSISGNAMKPDKFKSFKKDNDLIMVALVATTNTMPVTTLLSTNDFLAVINLSDVKSTDNEIFSRRAERLVMRAIAFLSGLPPSPDGYCVTRDFRSLAELDKMGRNLCPPWKSKFNDYARESKLAMPIDDMNFKRPDKATPVKQLNHAE